MKFKQTNQISSPLKTSQSTLNKAHVIEIIKACKFVFTKAKDSFVIQYTREERVNWQKKQDSEHLSFKASSWQILVDIKMLFMVQQSCYWWPTIKWTSWNGKYDMGRLDVQFVKNIPLQMVIGQQMKEEGHDQNY